MQQAQRIAHRLLELVVVDEPGGADDPLEVVSGDLRLDERVLGAVAEDQPTDIEATGSRASDRGHHGRRALLRDLAAGEEDERLSGMRLGRGQVAAVQPADDLRRPPQTLRLKPGREQA